MRLVVLRCDQKGDCGPCADARFRAYRALEQAIAESSALLPTVREIQHSLALRAFPRVSIKGLKVGGFSDALALFVFFK